MKFTPLSSVAFMDSQYAEIPNELPVWRCVFIHGAMVHKGNGPVREIETVEVIARRLADKYARQIPDPATFADLCCIDYEPWTGADGPNGTHPLAIKELNLLLVECLEKFRQIMPLAKLSIWGLPTSRLLDSGGKRDIEPEELQPVWNRVDWLAPHDYSGVNDWHRGQRDSTAARLANAHYAGLPVVPVICPRMQPMSGWIDSAHVLQRATMLKRLGAAGVIYWDGKIPAEALGADYFERWTRDCELLRALMTT